MNRNLGTAKIINLFSFGSCSTPTDSYPPFLFLLDIRYWHTPHTHTIKQRNDCRALHKCTEEIGNKSTIGANNNLRMNVCCCAHRFCSSIRSLFESVPASFAKHSSVSHHLPWCEYESISIFCAHQQFCRNLLLIEEIFGTNL